MRPYILSECRLGEIKNHSYSIAILPWGATEAHNTHLPYGTDNYETIAFAEEAARLAWEQNAKSIVLPAIPYGVNTGQLDIPGTVNLYPSTQASVLDNILESISEWGIHRFLLLNGHGGNDFRQILRESGKKFPDMLLVTANWYQSVDKSKFFEKDGDHADEMETSLMMHLQPEIVLPLEKAGDGHSRAFRSELLNEKWAWSERKWSKVTKDTGIGDPRSATAEKGSKYFNEVSGKVASLIIQLASLDPQNPYE